MKLYNIRPWEQVAVETSVNVIKFLSLSLELRENKLECMFMDSFFSLDI